MHAESRLPFNPTPYSLARCRAWEQALAHTPYQRCMPGVVLSPCELYQQCAGGAGPKTGPSQARLSALLQGSWCRPPLRRALLPLRRGICLRLLAGSAPHAL